MKDFRDYYQVLGVPRTATTDEIRAAYRRAARRHHPDVSKAADASARMAEVNEAHEVLSDTAKRSAYDAYGQRHGEAPAFQPPPGRGAHPGFGFPGREGPAGAPENDLFSSIFGRRASRPARPGAKPGDNPFKGSDQEASVEITIADAYDGATRTITLHTPARPSTAAVSGSQRASSRTLEVKIPKGVRHGQRVRLAGQGAPSLSGGSPGDLHLEVRFVDDPKIRAEGRDVYQKLPIAPWEAALGATIEAPTVAGRVELRIPPGSQSGRRLRLKGKGLPAAEPGDLVLEIDIVTPPADSEAARKLYAQMARDLAFDPRAAM